MKSANSRIYLSSPHMGGEELDYVHDAFTNNWIAPLGANVDGFENDLQDYTGRKYAGVVTSGTAALHLALILCGVKSGDEVICQSMTFAASANPILYQGAVPVFVDSEPETWNMDPELLERAIWDRIQKKEKPKAIIVVHLYGMPAQMDAILRIAKKYNIPVIEDAAEALGSSINDQKCGTFGLLSVLSFNGNKIITTSGGGALLSDQQDLIDKARFLATQARDEAPHYQHSELGFNYRMSNIVAGIGRGQMKVLDQRVSARRKNHDFYFEALEGSWLDGVNMDLESGIQNSDSSGIYFLEEPEGYFSNRWLTTIVINPVETGGITNNDIRLAMEEENIETRPLWKPMHQQPLYKNFPYYGRGVSDILFDHGLCLPSGSNLSNDDKEKIADTIKKVLRVKRVPT
ncbi:DegT/DnrJ/EryC1/StrS family aminotransferase [Fodinibius sp. SL11]|uniref:DegT/DnrJ/EryC1/StrS family aminotransferase n=1 Tax=Fodinibius sp. SL11 TaxID=3425690 RepID=UPI003F88431F